MKKKVSRQEAEIIRLYALLETLTPGTEQYEKVLGEILRLKQSDDESNRIKNEKIDSVIRIGTTVLTAVLTPALTYVLNRKTINILAAIEKDGILPTSGTAGRLLSSNFFKRT